LSYGGGEAIIHEGPTAASAAN